MKRTAVNDAGHSPKRHKSEPLELECFPDPFDARLQKNARDVCANGTDGSGFISGIAFMVWPGGGSGARRVLMQVEEQGRIEQFELKLSGRCRKYFERLDFCSKDHFEISLKGAEMEKKQESSKPFHLPMALTYNQGVIIKFTKRIRKPTENGLVIDTWQLEEADRRREEAIKLDEEHGRSFWFTPPVNPFPDRLISGLSMEVDLPDPIVVRRPENIDSTAPVSRDACPPPKAIASIGEDQAHQSVSPSFSADLIRAEATSNYKPKAHVTLAEESQIHTSGAQDVFDKDSNKTTTISEAKPVREAPLDTSNRVDSPQTSTSSNNLEGGNNACAPVVHAKEPSPPKLTKKQQRLLKKSQRAAAQAASASLDGQSVVVLGGSVQTISDPVATTTPNVSSPVPVTSSSNQNATETRDPFLDLHAGFWTEVGDKYTPLSDVTASSGPFNVTGVVTSIRATEKTRSKDLSCSLTLVDPSNFDVDNVMGPIDGLGVRVNCFTAKYAGWLPSPKVGDVLILRGVKQSGDRTLVGYKDRLRWAIFNPEAGKLHHGDRGEAPESEGLADGFGYEFCPFWKAKEAELTHCLRLTDWWLAALKKVQSNMGQVHQIGSDVSYLSGSKARRQHRLISEASPDMPPNGFFDCTVEIIKGFLNDNDVYSLYVTDYTINPKVTPVQGSWCPPELADRILKVEMWDTASQLAQTMEPGEYWFLRNARMKVSGHGYMEGTMQLAEKVRKLNENDPMQDPHLEALLERKREWEKIDHSVDGPFEHQAIEDVQKGQFFDCTVEVLNADYNPNGLSYIYITDYTVHPDLPVVPASSAWSRGLEKRIVKVVLWDEQMSMANSVEPGCYYTIRKLRLMQSTMGGQFQGRLGGTERLIHRLKSIDTGNARLAKLLQRKQAWEQVRKMEDERSLEKKGGEINVTDVDISHPYPLPGFNSISEILANAKCPNKFRLIARIKEFYPLHLEECVILRCMKCQEILRATRKECVKCSDLVDSYVKCLYCFFFLLEDADGKNLLISISDEEGSLLRGLEPADLREDRGSLEEFTSSLNPVIGNLLEVHSGIERGEFIASETPMLKLVIDSWKNPDSISYGLMDLEVIRDSSL